MVGWSGAAKVGVAAAGGTMTVVGEGIAVLTGVMRGRRVFVAVSTGIVEVGAARVRVGRAVPAPAWPEIGHVSKVRGKFEQFVPSTHTLRLKAVCWAPRQSRMRCPLTSCAVKHVTRASGSATLKLVFSPRINTACGSSFTQNWHCRVTGSSPVTGIDTVGVRSRPLQTPVTAGLGLACPSAGRIVPTGVSPVAAGRLQALVKISKRIAAARDLREKSFIPGTPRIFLKIIWTHASIPRRSNEPGGKTVISEESVLPAMGGMGQGMSLPR